MHIILKNKFLYFGHYKIKCAIGKRGISRNKREGDHCTPVGKFKFESLFFRKDRIKNLIARIPKKTIKKNMGWCDDTRSTYRGYATLRFMQPPDFGPGRATDSDPDLDCVLRLHNFYWRTSLQSPYESLIYPQNLRILSDPVLV